MKFFMNYKLGERRGGGGGWGGGGSSNYEVFYEL